MIQLFIGFIDVIQQTINRSFDYYLIEHNVSSDQSPIVINRSNVSLYVEYIEHEEKQFVEIIISPFPVIANCKPFSAVISITQPELVVSPSQSSISHQMCTVTAGRDFSDNTGICNDHFKDE